MKIAFLLIQHGVLTKRLNGFRFFLGKKCIHKITVNLNLSCSVSFRKFKPYAKKSISKNCSNWFLNQVSRSHICTRFGHYLTYKFIYSALNKKMSRRMTNNISRDSKYCRSFVQIARTHIALLCVRVTTEKPRTQKHGHIIPFGEGNVRLGINTYGITLCS